MKTRDVLLASMALSNLLGAAALGHAAPAALDARNKQPTRLRAVTGHACLTFREIVRPQIAMKEMYDHVVTVENRCPDTISVKVCYKNAATGCRKLRVGAHKKAAALLGSMYNQPSFGFDYTETYAN